MKFRVTFKTPNALNDVYNQEAFDPETMCDCGGRCIDCDRLLYESDETIDEMNEVARKFVQCGEVIVVEFDTEKDTATVIPIQG